MMAWMSAVSSAWAVPWQDDHARQQNHRGAPCISPSSSGEHTYLPFRADRVLTLRDRDIGTSDREDRVWLAESV